MRQHPHLVHARQQQRLIGPHQQQQPHSHSHSHPHHQQSHQSQHSDTQIKLPEPPQSSHYQMHAPQHIQMQQHSGDMHKKHKRGGQTGGQYLNDQRSFSSSEEELRSTPEFEGEFFIRSWLSLHFYKLFSLYLNIVNFN